MTITSRGFSGVAYQYDESSLSASLARGVEGSYRHVLTSGGAVTAGAGRAVSVAPFDAWVAGTWHVSDSASVVTLDANPGTNPRIDVVVLDVDWVADSATVTKVNGVAAAAPTPANLTQTPGVRYQMPLAQVTVPGGATALAAGNIEAAAVRPSRFGVFRDDVSPQTIRGNASSWVGLGSATIDDPGRPYRLQISSSVRFNATETGGYMRTRVANVNTGAVHAEAVSDWLGARRSPAVMSAHITGVLTGSRRLRLEIFPADVGAGELVQVLDHPSNHLTILQLLV